MSQTTHAEVTMTTWKTTQNEKFVEIDVQAGVAGGSYFRLRAPANSPLWKDPTVACAIVDALFHARRAELAITGKVEA